MKSGDELIAIDGLRVSDSKSLKKILTGRANTSAKITISSFGKLSKVDVEIKSTPEYPLVFKGNGNDYWKSMKKSRL